MDKARKPAPPLVDAHLHLQDGRFPPAERRRIIARALDAGVGLLVVNAVDETDWRPICALAAAHGHVIPALGLHPWHAATAGKGWEERLRAACRAHGAHIGECGLDKPCGVDPRTQERIFLAQLAIAAEFGRTASIHCVKRWGRLLDILRSQGRSSAIPVIHSFGGSPEMVDSLVRAGAYVSFSCRLAAPGQDRLRQAFARVPMERLLLESDAPDQFCEALAPAAASGRNEPAFVAALYRHAAAIRRMDMDEFICRIHENAQIFTN